MRIIIFSFVLTMALAAGAQDVTLNDYMILNNKMHLQNQQRIENLEKTVAQLIEYLDNFVVLKTSSTISK